MTKEDSERNKIYNNIKIKKLDPLSEKLDAAGFTGGASKGLKIKGIKYPKDVDTKFSRKIFRDRLERPRGPGKNKQGPKPKKEEIVSFDTKKVYVKDN